jgi:hypothetical protein
LQAGKRHCAQADVVKPERRNPSINAKQKVRGRGFPDAVVELFAIKVSSPDNDVPK